MDAFEKLQQSSKMMTDHVLELVESVKQRRVSAIEAFKLINKFTAIVYVQMLIEPPHVQALLQPQLDFFSDARRLIAQAKRNEN